MKKVHILFVCKYNRFRSRLAAALFAKNAPKQYNVSSAGLIKGNPIDQTQRSLCKKYAGVDISGTPQGLSAKLLAQQDIIVIVAKDVPKHVFSLHGKYLRRVIRYPIVDTPTSDEKSVAPVIRNVERSIKQLLVTL